MREMKIKTPSGREVVVNENDSTTHSRISKEDKHFYLIVKHEGLNVVVAKEMEKEVESFYSVIAAEKASMREEEINKRIPGFSELANAYNYRYDQIITNQKYMERGHRTSIFFGDSGKPEEADPSSSYGFAANRAAKALYDGATLAEAEKIANDWDKNN